MGTYLLNGQWNASHGKRGRRRVASVAAAAFALGAAAAPAGTVADGRRARRARAARARSGDGSGVVVPAPVAPSCPPSPRCRSSLRRVLRRCPERRRKRWFPPAIPPVVSPDAPAAGRRRPPLRLRLSRVRRRLAAQRPPRALPRASARGGSGGRSRSPRPTRRPRRLRSLIPVVILPLIIHLVLHRTPPKRIRQPLRTSGSGTGAGTAIRVRLPPFPRRRPGRRSGSGTGSGSARAGLRRPPRGPVGLRPVQRRRLDPHREPGQRRRRHAVESRSLECGCLERGGRAPAAQPVPPQSAGPPPAATALDAADPALPLPPLGAGPAVDVQRELAGVVPALRPGRPLRFAAETRPRREGPRSGRPGRAVGRSIAPLGAPPPRRRAEPNVRAGRVPRPPRGSSSWPRSRVHAAGVTRRDRAPLPGRRRRFRAPRARRSRRRARGRGHVRLVRSRRRRIRADGLAGRRA